MTPVLNQQEDAVTCHTTKPEKTGIANPGGQCLKGGRSLQVHGQGLSENTSAKSFHSREVYTD